MKNKKKKIKHLLYLCIIDDEGNGLVFETLKQLKPYSVVVLDGKDEDDEDHQGTYVVTEDWKQGMNICIKQENWKDYLDSL